jgi:hypothetical protein
MRFGGTWLWTAGFTAAIAALGIGCIVDNTTSGGGGSTGGTGTPIPNPSATSVGGDGGAPSNAPILVDVDPNRTLNATPGDGVGVFVEYATGGHWHVWWSCDTNKTSQGCAFNVDVTVAQGAITNAKADGAVGTTGCRGCPGATVTSPSATEVTGTSSTTSTLDGMTFDADPTAIITVSAGIGDPLVPDASRQYTYDGSYFFFVQSGVVNGGFTGHLSDPLSFEAKLQ